MMYDIDELDPVVRNCDGCTKCCEGYLYGQSYGKQFMHGRPCHFALLGKGCSIYEDRPHSPCQTFKCVWVIDTKRDFPEWMKPSLSNVIIVPRHINDILYIDVVEAGAKIDSTVLNWLFLYTLEKKVNMRVQIAGGHHNYGTKEFQHAMKQLHDAQTKVIENSTDSVETSS